MRFSKVLHPEIVLDRRGSDIARELIRESTGMLKFRDEGVLFESNPNSDMSHVLAMNFRVDPVFLRFMITCKRFKEQKAPVYHIGREFLQTLQKIDREIPVDILPDGFLAYFSFADNTIFDDDGPVEGGYVGVDWGRNIGMKPELKDTRILSFAYVNATDLPVGPFASLTVPLDAKKISDLAAGAPIEDFMMDKRTPEQIKKRNDVFRALLNAVIYLHSDDPSIEWTRPFKELGLSAKEMKRRDQVINECSVPVYFVNRKYVKHRSYTVDSTWIDSFPRWQRCGPNLSRVKLVYVTPHERKYGKTYEEGQNSD